MTSRRTNQEARDQELRELRQKFGIDPAVMQRVRELAEAGKADEASQVARDYIWSHPALAQKIQGGPDAWANGKYVPFKEILRRKQGGRRGCWRW